MIVQTGRARRTLAVSLLLITVPVVAGCDPDTTATPAAVPEGAQTAVVERIVDGDTIAIRALREGPVLESTAQITVRLLEIDTPETKRPGSPVQCFGAEASAYTSRLLGIGTQVWVLPDEERTDRYGRDLLYVWTANGVFANREIVRTGHAKAVLYPPNDLYIEQIRAAQLEARAAHRGLWGSCRG